MTSVYVNSNPLVLGIQDIWKMGIWTEHAILWAARPGDAFPLTLPTGMVHSGTPQIKTELFFLNISAIMMQAGEGRSNSHNTQG